MTDFHLMIDLETLSLKPNTIVLSAGLVRFPTTGVYSSVDEFKAMCQMIYFEFDIAKQEEQGRIFEMGTMLWWMQQTQAHFPIKGTASVLDLKLALSALWAQNTADKICQAVWSHGVDFDIAIVENWLNHIVPWTYRERMDTRTLYKLFGVTSAMLANNHHALADAVNQAWYVFRCLNAIDQNIGPSVYKEIQGL
jgi:hypothetical protein